MSFLIALLIFAVEKTKRGPLGRGLTVSRAVDGKHRSCPSIAAVRRMDGSEERGWAHGQLTGRL